MGWLWEHRGDEAEALRPQQQPSEAGEAQGQLGGADRDPRAPEYS